MALEHSMILVARPRGWTPSSEFDVPKRAVVIEVIDDEIGDPATYVRQYNAASMREAGTTWAAVVKGSPQPGREHDLTRFAARASPRSIPPAHSMCPKIERR